MFHTSANLFFGRFQPLTKAHTDVITRLSFNPDPTFIFTSHTKDNKNNPLSYGEKLETFQHWSENSSIFAGNVMFPNLKKEVVNSPADAIRYLGLAGFENLKFWAGQDRLDNYSDFLKYVGHPTKAWPNIQKIVLASTGDRDPDSDEFEGISGSKVRGFAKVGNFSSFEKMMPIGFTLKQSERLYTLVRKGLGILDEETNRSSPYIR